MTGLYTVSVKGLFKPIKISISVALSYFRTGSGARPFDLHTPNTAIRTKRGPQCLAVSMRPTILKHQETLCGRLSTPLSTCLRSYAHIRLVDLGFACLLSRLWQSSGDKSWPQRGFNIPVSGRPRKATRRVSLVYSQFPITLFRADTFSANNALKILVEALRMSEIVLR